MPKLFKNKFRVESTRLPGYDYSQPGYYFITICTKNRIAYLGNIINGEMVLNKDGEIIKNELLKTEIMRPNVKLDEWIIMPNHIHVIIIIVDNADNVETHCNASLHNHNHNRENDNIPPYQNKFGPQRNNLASIIRGFKSTTAKQINQKTGFDYFAWQPCFYDHIVKNKKSLDNIRLYIKNNPIIWHRDRNNPDGLLM